MQHTARPPVAKLIEMLLPNASHDEQVQATEDLREFLAVAYRIYLRLKREGKWPPRDKSAPPDTVETPSHDSP